MNSSVVLRCLAQGLRILVYRGNFPLVKLILIVVWIVVLSWGERRSFGSATQGCSWENWEDWPEDATPHHLIFIADPQLVDPHTYPGRPWPLNRLTVAHTDQYLRRSYQSLQQDLDPDSIIFLGDLFDGGREWWTGKGSPPEDKTWKDYGNDFWLKEYDRWGKIFLKDNGKPERGSAHPRGDRKIIASLPGNHDLGISNGVRIDVRNRFSMFFGEGNRVDVIGNHTFVSVDTVSLTAKAQEQQARDASKEIWEEPSKFLDSVQQNKAQAWERYLNGKNNLPENPKLVHAVYDVDSLKGHTTKPNTDLGIYSDIPTILLTHVPLFRGAGTPCGPLREKYPPKKGFNNIASEKLDEDNAIALRAGYQYQNVLQPETSKELINKVGNVEHVFSGDDHDYCEVVHHGYTSNGGGIREITVKSISWAMGIRRPGFLLVSLWNPIDSQGKPISSSSQGKPTLQTHLCLLPDALGTLLTYAKLFFITAAVLAFFAHRRSQAAFNGSKSGSPILPLSKSREDDFGNNAAAANMSSGTSSASSSVSDPGSLFLAARASKNRTGSPSSNNGWALPVEKVEPDPMFSPLKGNFSIKALLSSSKSTFSAITSDDNRGTGRGISGKAIPMDLMKEEFAAGLIQIGIVGFTYFFWLAKSF